MQQNPVFLAFTVVVKCNPQWNVIPVLCNKSKALKSLKVWLQEWGSALKNTANFLCWEEGNGTVLINVKTNVFNTVNNIWYHQLHEADLCTTSSCSLKMEISSKHMQSSPHLSCRNKHPHSLAHTHIQSLLLFWPVNLLTSHSHTHTSSLFFVLASDNDSNTIMHCDNTTSHLLSMAVHTTLQSPLLSSLHLLSLRIVLRSIISEFSYKAAGRLAAGRC